MIKHKINRIIIIAAVIFVFFTNGSAAKASEISSAKMLELTNESRSAAGLSLLSSDEKLDLAAKAKAEDMFKYQYFEHTSPEGVTPWYWFDFVGYDYIYAAENLALDFNTAEGVHSALMKSTGHRENILGVNYEEVGIAVMSGDFKGKRSVIVVEEFGMERQQKVSKISDAFFEEASDETKRAPSIKTEAAQKTVKIADKQQEKKNIAPEERLQTAPVITSKIDLVPKVTQEPGQHSLESASAGLGKVVPQIYSVRGARTLKKAYVENIYWEKTDGEELTFSLNHGKAIFKALFRDLTNGLMQRLTSK